MTSHTVCATLGALASNKQAIMHGDWLLPAGLGRVVDVVKSEQHRGLATVFVTGASFDLPESTLAWAHGASTALLKTIDFAKKKGRLPKGFWVFQACPPKKQRKKA